MSLLQCLFFHDVYTGLDSYFSVEGVFRALYKFYKRFMLILGFQIANTEIIVTVVSMLVFIHVYMQHEPYHMS